jgi:hypothetical protein
MSISDTDQRQWKAPTGDGEIVVWPEPQALVESVRENQRLLNGAHSARIANVPLPELRRDPRAWVGHRESQQPLIMTAHQIELHHPGVWAKNVLIHELASAVGGMAYHVAVDTDAPKHLHLRWPDGSWPITDDPRLVGVPWLGLLRSPTPGHMQAMANAFEVASGEWSFTPLVSEYLTVLSRLTPESADLTYPLTTAEDVVQRKLGLRYHTLLASSAIWGSSVYLAFAHHILANADSFAHAYNRALHEYRRTNRIRNTGRPWPDLNVTADEVEVPFWIDSLRAEKRTRGHVVRRDGRFAIRADDRDIFSVDPAAEGLAAGAALAKFLSDRAMRLSPRAMTLTCFLRLFMADQFVHGIGGARYDQVTDQVIERWFGLRAPAFSVTTATLLFPAAAGEDRVDVRAVAREGRRLRHASDAPWKRQMASQIASLPRQSAERSRVYYEMHSMLDDDSNRRAEYQQWQQRYEHARALAQRQEALSDRELFFAIQPPERLKSLIEKYHHTVTRAVAK